MRRHLRLLAAVGASSLAAATSAPVQVSLKTSWPSPPFLVEILETVALENPNEFFSYLDLLTNPDVIQADKLSDEFLRKEALEVAMFNGLDFKTGWLANTQMRLALHSATPKIEAFYNYYESYVNKTGPGPGCESWVDWYGDVVCDVEALARLAGTDTIGTGSYPRPQVLTFDHIHPSPDRVVKRPPRTAILYGDLLSPNFRDLHSYLYNLARQEDPRVEYVLRHVPPKARQEGPSSTLSGYGVALALKKMDYLALDDRFAANNQDRKVYAETVWDHVQELINTYPDVDAPTTGESEDFAALGPKAVQLIANSDIPLETFLSLSQDFPKYATQLARRVVANESVVQELHDNSLKARGGINMVWINGVTVEPHDIEPLPLLRMLKKERQLMLSLIALGLDREQAFELLTHSIVSAAQRSTPDALYDASDREEGGDITVWWNDMEKDARYSRWSPTLHTLIRPMYPGQFPSVKANLFNTVLAVDLSHVPTINFIVGPVSNIVERGLPFRFGVVPIVETEDGKKMARLFYYLIKNYGRKKTLSVLRKISKPETKPSETIPTISWSAAQEAYQELVADDTETKPAVFEHILSGKVELGEGISAEAIENILAAYHKRLETTLESSKGGHAFFNGKHYPFDEQLLQHLQTGAMEQQQYFMEQVYRGVLTDDMLKEHGLGNHFYDLPTTNKNRNRYIYPKTRTDVKILNIPEVFERADLKFDAESYVYPNNAEGNVPVLTTYVIGDFDSEGGRDLAQEALKATQGAKAQSRITFIPNPIEWEAVKPNSVNAAVSKSVIKKLAKDSASAIGDVLGSMPSTNVGDDTQTPIGVELTAKELRRYLKSSQILVREAGLKPGESALVVNGRVVGPIAPKTFPASDIETLEAYEIQKRTGPVVGALNAVAPNLMADKFKFAHAASVASALVSWIQIPDPSETGLFDTPPRPRQRNYEQLASNYTALEFGEKVEALYHVVFIVDPLSPTGQKWASLIQWLAAMPNIYIEVHLNPADYKEMPLKQFYRYNVSPQLWFDKSEKEIKSQITFEGLPIDPIYTLAMDVPASWLVKPRESRYDLDNIQLGQLFPEDSALTAVFSLDALLIEGHAREVTSQAPPRGVQLQAVTTTAEGKSVPIQDTLVVANLGYFQFRLTPGVFGLEIREGNGRKIYTMESVGGIGWDSPTVEEVGDQVALTDFEGVTLFPRLKRRPGMEDADVLAEDQESEGGILGNLSSKVKSMFWTKKPQETGLAVKAREQAEINIFTVASGLLYERFASIMILSVLKNTKSTVKFWFIENFLSPSFLEFIPHMAAEYKFDYELVTYRWPSWLRAQTEKQRIIWAYKILFLDVLFPMDLKKVIFVDADQIVRADLKELVDLDLEGAPYGYTPMGDDNTDMEGFRFWKTGYWKDFLQGKPYHISALYVIDLVRFRQMAAGDILRGQYQALSADPNSLANLDQDLPNNLQKQVPIFSLGEDWLWCETWCSKDRLDRAKTIDLCQNPLTKEPKLSRARQIPEWELYDAEIARLTRRLAEEGKISSGLSTADANVLAGGSRTSATSASEQREEDESGDKQHGGDDSEPPKEVQHEEL